MMREEEREGKSENGKKGKKIIHFLDSKNCLND
jgi:hypothetical protein